MNSFFKDKYRWERIGKEEKYSVLRDILSEKYEALKAEQNES